MKNMLMLGVVGLVAFGAALGAGWWMNRPAGEGDHADAHAGGHDSHGDSQGESHDAAHHTEQSTEVAHDSHGPQDVSAHDVESDLPLPVRPRAISTQEIFQIATRLQEREAAVAQREHQLQEREDRMNLILLDLKNEQQLVEGLRAEIRSLLQSGEDLSAQIGRDQQALDARELELEAQLPTGSSAAARPAVNQQNIRMIADTIKGLEPAKAAELLTKIIEGGDMDFVIQVYAQLDDRDAAAIGAELDPDKLTEILTGMRDYERPEASASSTSPR
jgi:hypothetical protein